MALRGIGLGFFAFCLVGWFVGDVVFHNAGAGFFPGLVAALWAAWPLFAIHTSQRADFLHPLPKRYPVNNQVAFTKAIEFLREFSYSFGDRWHIVTADVASNRIVADLRFFDEESHPEAAGRGISTRTVRVQRRIRLEAQFDASYSAETIVKLNFYTQIEGFNFRACDAIITEVKDSLDMLLCGGIEVGASRPFKLSAPPVWLLGVTALMLLFLLGDTQKALSGQ